MLKVVRDKKTPTTVDFDAAFHEMTTKYKKGLALEAQDSSAYIDFIRFKVGEVLNDFDFDAVHDGDPALSALEKLARYLEPFASSVINPRNLLSFDVYKQNYEQALKVLESRLRHVSGSEQLAKIHGYYQDIYHRYEAMLKSSAEATKTDYDLLLRACFLIREALKKTEVLRQIPTHLTDMKAGDEGKFSKGLVFVANHWAELQDFAGFVREPGFYERFTEKDLAALGRALTYYQEQFADLKLHQADGEAIQDIAKNLEIVLRELSYVYQKAQKRIAMEQGEKVRTVQQVAKPAMAAADTSAADDELSLSRRPSPTAIASATTPSKQPGHTPTKSSPLTPARTPERKISPRGSSDSQPGLTPRKFAFEAAQPALPTQTPTTSPAKSSKPADQRASSAPTEETTTPRHVSRGHTPTEGSTSPGHSSGEHTPRGKLPSPRSSAAGHVPTELASSPQSAGRGVASLAALFEKKGVAGVITQTGAETARRDIPRGAGAVQVMLPVAVDKQAATAPSIKHR